MLHKKLVMPPILSIPPNPEGGPACFLHYTVVNTAPCTRHHVKRRLCTLKIRYAGVVGFFYRED